MHDLRKNDSDTRRGYRKGDLHRPERGNTVKGKVEGTNFIPRKDVNRDAFTVSQAFSLDRKKLSTD